MPTLQNYDNPDIFVEPVESEKDKQARLARLRAAKIKRELKAIDDQRIRPLAAIATGTATDYDRSKLAELETRAQGLRTELTSLEV